MKIKITRAPKLNYDEDMSPVPLWHLIEQAPKDGTKIAIMIRCDHPNYIGLSTDIFLLDCFWSNVDKRWMKLNSDGSKRTTGGREILFAYQKDLMIPEVRK